MRKSFPTNKRAMALAAVLYLVIFAAVVVLSLSTYLIQRLRAGRGEQARLETVYLAQAGVQQALYDYRQGSFLGIRTFDTGQFDLDDQHHFVIGGTDADLLMVDTTETSLSGNKSNYLMNFYLQSAANGRTVTIDQMLVSWDNDQTLRKIRINGKMVYNGQDSSPVLADIDDVTLNPYGMIYILNYLRFSQDMTGATIDVRFIMSDGTYKDVTLYPASDNNNFTVKATGVVDGTGVSRTVAAEYNTVTEKVLAYYESADKITP